MPTPSAPEPGSPSATVLSKIEALFAKLQQGVVSPAELSQFQRELMEGDARASIAAILEFLASGRDAETGGEFTVDEGGKLSGSPTLRVMLMDTLGQLARAVGSGEAAAIARATLETKNSADEWAISLRNVAWHEPQATAFLAGKMREMFAHQPWRARPSAGMLEAFDVVVFTRDTSLVPPLAEMAGGHDRQLQRAAAVALDRFSEAAPLQMMIYLNGNPAVMSERPFVRADYFAKADLAQPQQRQALEIYLSRSDVSTAEKTKLLKALVTPASFISENLLTSSLPPTDEDARLAAVTKAIGEWVQSGRFNELRPQLLQIQDELR